MTIDQLSPGMRVAIVTHVVGGDAPERFEYRVVRVHETTVEIRPLAGGEKWRVYPHQLELAELPV